MSEYVLFADSSANGAGAIATATSWIARVATAGILGMGAFTKFLMYTPDGSMALANAMGVGRGVILSIGIVELAAATLILIPRRHVLGAVLAAATMSGACLPTPSRSAGRATPRRAATAKRHAAQIHAIGAKAPERFRPPAQRSQVEDLQQRILDSARKSMDERDPS